MTLYFTNDHEWLNVEGDVVTIGISHHAQQQLGDIVFIELPDVGREVKMGDSIAVVESVKAASDVYAPIEGQIVEVNGKIADEPAKVNDEAETDGWFVKIKLNGDLNTEGLMDLATYKNYAR